MSKFKLSFYNVITGIINEEQEIPKQILYATRTGKAAVLESKTIDIIQKGNFEEIPITILSELLDIEAVVPFHENELDVVLGSNQAAINDNTDLGIVIQPGASCQLGCGYCGQQHTKKYMDDSTQILMIDRINAKIKTGTFKSLSITWYGAEPLMALKQIRELSPKLISLASENGLSYEASMITNALSLKEEIFLELVQKYKLNSFQITIDGDVEFHDKRRHTKEYKPTFDIIFNNILKITSLPNFKELKAEIVIRCNADKNNIDGIVPLIHRLANHNLQDKINFYVAPIHDWGDNGAAIKDGVKKDDFANLEIDWMIELIKLGFNVAFLPDRSKIVCMVVNKDSEVYDAYGNVSTCWEVPYTPVYENTDNYIGNLKLPILTPDSDAPMRNWNIDIKKGETWCAKCNILPICGGQCPKKWLDGTPACPTYKFNIEDRLIMEYINKQSNFKDLISAN